MFNIISFNNYARAMLTIFVAITLEGWVLMMYNYMDCNSGPVSIVFFVLVVIIGNFLLLNLVLAQIMESFYASQEIEKEKEEMEAKKKQKKEDAEYAKENQDS
jgi:voltage-dependent calcium channel L type alpha-1D